jgi:uncharacterized protein (TIGR00251 family)
MSPPRDWQPLRVRVTPRAQSDRIVGWRADVLQVRVRAPPADGRANASVCRLIAKRLGVGVSRITVVRGETSREKTLRVEGLTAEALAAALPAPDA